VDAGIVAETDADASAPALESLPMEWDMTSGTPHETPYVLGRRVNLGTGVVSPFLYATSTVASNAAGFVPRFPHRPLTASRANASISASCCVLREVDPVPP
jgi:hypothetical protein